MLLNIQNVLHLFYGRIYRFGNIGGLAVYSAVYRITHFFHNARILQFHQCHMGSHNIQQIYNGFSVLEINNIVLFTEYLLRLYGKISQNLQQLFGLLLLVADKFKMISLFGVTHRA